MVLGVPDGYYFFAASCYVNIFRVQPGLSLFKGGSLNFYAYIYFSLCVLFTFGLGTQMRDDREHTTGYSYFVFFYIYDCASPILCLQQAIINSSSTSFI